MHDRIPPARLPTQPSVQLLAARLATNQQVNWLSGLNPSLDPINPYPCQYL